MQFDKSLIKILLRKFVIMQEHSTHYFVNCCSSFTGSASMPDLRKYLNHMVSKGWVKKFKYPGNYHKWQITQDGMNVLKLIESDPFII